MPVAVVGGGIAGLAAAYDLGQEVEVALYEPGRLGGKIRTSEFAGVPVDEGPDAFLTRAPGAVELCTELGLTPRLVAPSAGRTMLLSGGRLRPLPGGLVLGVPTAPGELARSGLLSAPGLLRAGLDLVLPRSRFEADVSVDELIGRRFGAEVAEKLVEPLLGSIHAARTADLSAAATAPNLLAAARASRSLFFGLRAQQAATANGPAFLTPQRGLSDLVSALQARLTDLGVTFTTSAVTSVRPVPGGVEVDGERFDGAVLAVPAPLAAGLMGEAAPPGLGLIRLTDVTVVTAELGRAELPVADDINGILVPPGEGLLMTACSFGTNKWPHWAATPDRMVVRISAGRSGDSRPGQMTDDELADRLVADLGRAVGATLAPNRVRVSRWPGAFPLYEVGHLQRVDDIEADLMARAPHTKLAGSSYRGAGIPACITSGRRAASALLAEVH